MMMTHLSPGRILADGLWHNNQALVALLGLCPLLAVTSTAINGLGLGLATALTLVVTNAVVAGIRPWLRKAVRIPVFVLVIASVVTTLELLMNAHLHGLYKVLGIFVPLIVTNCAVIGRAEAFASKNGVGYAALDGLSMGLGFTAVLVVLGGLREIVGYGTLFRQADLMFGAGGEWLTVTLLTDYDGFLLAILPPGAFMGLALLIALKNKVDRVLAERTRRLRTAAPRVEAATTRGATSGP
jgi:electron transport complex protein RnfE